MSMQDITVELGYVGEMEDLGNQGGYSVVYSGNNVKNFDVRSDITYISSRKPSLGDTTQIL